MALVDEAWWTVIEYVFIIIFVSILLLVFIIVQLDKTFFVGWFISSDPFDEINKQKTISSYGVSTTIEQGHSSVFSISQIEIDDRTFLEHLLYSKYKNENGIIEEQTFKDVVGEFIKFSFLTFYFNIIDGNNPNEGLDIDIPLFYKSIKYEVNLYY